MCTILTINRELFDSAPGDVIHRIYTDNLSNSDGACLLLVDETGQAIANVRTFDIQAVVTLLSTLQWDRMFLHQRFATQGVVSLENIHGWSEGGVTVMHNGCLRNPEAKSKPVDSMLILDWLRLSGIEGAMSELRAETFANVFLIDEYGYVVSRSVGGSLYTDGNGNFSTAPVGPITSPVIVGRYDYDFPYDHTPVERSRLDEAHLFNELDIRSDAEFSDEIDDLDMIFLNNRFA